MICFRALVYRSHSQPRKSHPTVLPPQANGIIPKDTRDTIADKDVSYQDLHTDGTSTKSRD